MTSDTLAQKLTNYYKGAYSDERLEELKRFCANIAEADLDQLYAAIIEERTVNSAIGVADIKEACQRVGIAYRQTIYVHDKKITCAACDEEYKYAPGPTDDQQLNGAIHDRCPACGFQHAWTMQARDTMDAGMKAEWYERYLNQFRQNGYGHGAAHGMWFQPDKNRRAVDSEKRRILNAKVESLKESMRVET